MAKPKHAEVYDFRRPTTLAREHSRTLELAFETFARQWGTQLTANMRTRSQVVFEEVAMKTYDQYAASLPSQTTMVLIKLGEEAAKMVIQYPTHLALSWFSHMFGGTGQHSEPLRPFTRVEQSLVRKLTEDTLDDLRYSMGPLLGVEMAVDSIQHNSQFAQAAATTEMMIIASFSVTTGENTATATVSIPSEILLRNLGDANPVANVADSRDRLAAQIARVPVEVSLQVPPVTVTAASVLGMAVGDVIPLNHNKTKPLRFAVGGTPLTRAALGSNGQRLACVITDPQENNE